MFGAVELFRLGLLVHRCCNAPQKEDRRVEGRLGWLPCLVEALRSRSRRDRTCYSTWRKLGRKPGLFGSFRDLSASGRTCYNTWRKLEWGPGPVEAFRGGVQVA